MRQSTTHLFDDPGFIRVNDFFFDPSFHFFFSVAWEKVSEWSPMSEEQKSEEAQYRKAVQAMESGDESAKTKVAFYKLSGRGGVEVDADGAVALLEERVKEGDYEAKWMLGLCCEYGIGTEQDIERAEKLYGESCEGGNVVGEFLKKNDEGGRGTGVMKVNGLQKWIDDNDNTYDDSYEQTGMTEEMKKRLCDVLCVAPWTELDLSCEFKIWEQERERRKVINIIMVKNREQYRSRRSKNDKWSIED